MAHACIVDFVHICPVLGTRPALGHWTSSSNASTQEVTSVIYVMGGSFVLYYERIVNYQEQSVYADLS